MSTISKITKRLGILPCDPDGLNSTRAKWANDALDCFMSVTNTGEEDVVCDFLCDLMHWCDRNNNDFDKELARAAHHYEAETTEEFT